MKRFLLVLLVVPLAACCSVSRAEYDALALRTDSLYVQVTAITAWATTTVPGESKSVNVMLSELAEIEKTYNKICKWAADQDPPIVLPNLCPGDPEVTPPPTGKPPDFPPQ